MQERDMKYGHPSNQMAGQCAGGNTPVRVSVASEIMDMADKLVGYSSDLSERVEGKLSSICRQGATACDSKQEPVRSLPPYFDMLREKFDRIERNLSAIRETLERVEL